MLLPLICINIMAVSAETNLDSSLVVLNMEDLSRITVSSPADVKQKLDDFTCLNIFVDSVPDVESSQKMAARFRGRAVIFLVTRGTKEDAVDNSTLLVDELKLPLQYISTTGHLGPLTCPKAAIKFLHKNAKECKFILRGRRVKVDAFGVPPDLYMHLSSNQHYVGFNPDIVRNVEEALDLKVTYIRETGWSKLGKDGRNIHGGVAKQAISQRQKAKQFYSRAKADKIVKYRYDMFKLHIRKEEVTNSTRVFTGAADFGMAGFIFNPLTYRSLDFSRVLSSPNTLLCCPQPKALSPYENIISPFSWPVWAGALANIVVISIVAQAMHHFGDGQRDYKQNHEAFVFFGISMGQSCTHSYARASMSMLAMFAIAYSFLMESAFSCNLRANLMQRRFQEPVDGIDDLQRMGRNFYFIGNPVWRFRFGKYEEGITYPSGAQTPRYVYDGMLEEDLCLMVTWPAVPLRYESVRRRPGLRGAAFDSLFRMGANAQAHGNTGLVLTKGSPWKRQLDAVLARLYDSGIFSRHMLRAIPHWYYPPGTKTESQDSDPEPFTLQHLAVQFMATSVGLLISVVAAAREMLDSYKMRRAKRGLAASKH